MKRTVIAAVLFLVSCGAALGQTGSGSVLWKKKGDFVSTREAGTQAGIENALNNVGTGGTIQIDAGRYQITQTLRLRFSGVNFVATSDSVILENAGSVNGDTILVITGAHCTVRGISFDGKKGSKSDGYGIHVEAQNVTLDKLWIYNTPDAAIHVHMGSHNATVQNCLIEYPGDATSTVGDGIIIHDSNDAKVLNNRVVGCKRYGVWVQGTSQRTIIAGNNINNCTDDGINTESTAKLQNINGNTIVGCLNDGIEQNSDSTIVSNNVVMRNPNFGIWSDGGGNGSSWWGNLCAYNGNYNMGIRNATADTLAGWAILSNMLIRPYGQQFEIETSFSGSVTRDVQFANNYCIGPTQTQAGNNHPALKVVSQQGGFTERISYIGNVIKDANNHGLWVTPLTVGSVNDLVASGNHFMNITGNGIRLQNGGDGTHQAYVFDNYYRNTSLAPESLGTEWSIEGSGGKVFSRSWKTVVEDSLRVNGPTLLLGNVTMPPPSFTDLITVGKAVAEDSLRIGTSSQTSPAVITGAVTLYDKATVFDSLRVVGINGTSPSLRVTQGNLLVDDGDITIGTVGGSVNADEIKFGDTVGHVKNIAPTGELHLGAGNTNSQVVLEADGDLRVDLGKLTVVDSLRSNGPVIADTGIRVTGSGYITGNWAVGNTGTFTKEGTDGNITFPATGSRINFGYTGDNFVGPTVGGGGLALTSNGGANKTVYLPGTGDEAQVNGKLVVRDSMRVMLPIKLGQTSGVPQFHVIGDGGSTASDSVTIVMNGSSNSSARTPKILYQRGGSPHAALQGSSLGPEIRWDQSLDLVLGALGTNTPTFRFDMTSGTTGSLAINKSGVATTPLALEVNGAGAFIDSLRANKGLYVGGQFISKHLSATASLDFNFTGVNCHDLTVTVTGAADGDVVTLGVPNAAVTTDAQYTAWVSSANTVTIRGCDQAGSGNPSSATFRVDVWQH